jgi:hypothetical protein
MVDQALVALVKDEGCASAAAKDNTDMSVMFIMGLDIVGYVWIGYYRVAESFMHTLGLVHWWSQSFYSLKGEREVTDILV